MAAGTACRAGIFAIEALTAVLSQCTVLFQLSLLRQLLPVLICVFLEMVAHGLESPLCERFSGILGFILRTGCITANKTGDHAAGVINRPESAHKEDNPADKIQLYTVRQLQFGSHDHRTDQ